MKKYSTHHDAARAFLAFLILLVAFSILLLFVTYKDNILASGQQYYLFITLTVVGMGLLFGLLYLSSNNNGKAKTVKAPAKSKSSKPAKKKKR